MEEDKKKEYKKKAEKDNEMEKPIGRWKRKAVWEKEKKNE